MSDSTMFENWPVGGVDAPFTGSSKHDSFSHDTADGSLGGNQHVQCNVLRYQTHLPHSGAGGAPLHEGEFGAGHKWTEAEGKVHEGVGPGGLPY